MLVYNFCSGTNSIVLICGVVRISVILPVTLNNASD